MLLHPRNLSEKECKKLKLNIDDTEPTRYYICADWDCSKRRGLLYSTYGLYSTFKNATCYCGITMDREISMEKEDVATSEGDGGVFVRGMTKYMVTDDLQALRRLKASLLSKSVLTNAFINFDLKSLKQEK
ncbi:hypothetical protein NE237_006672 [Protea cynaroides]|uniref:Uncharacterized protein n=1 Tax=Protea cynaroides TaxID=273540 RepID=A0A9Q0QVJ2_9MAGN|nr:hypothetical protein NE237_006672 [Protea cynaroides]